MSERNHVLVPSIPFDPRRKSVQSTEYTFEASYSHKLYFRYVSYFITLVFFFSSAFFSEFNNTYLQVLSPAFSRIELVYKFHLHYHFKIRALKQKASHPVYTPSWGPPDLIHICSRVAKGRKDPSFWRRRNGKEYLNAIRNGLENTITTRLLKFFAGLKTQTHCIERSLTYTIVNFQQSLLQVFLAQLTAKQGVAWRWSRMKGNHAKNPVSFALHCIDTQFRFSCKSEPSFS